MPRTLNVVHASGVFLLAAVANARLYHEAVALLAFVCLHLTSFEKDDSLGKKILEVFSCGGEEEGRGDVPFDSQNNRGRCLSGQNTEPSNFSILFLLCSSTIIIIMKNN
jgi:mannose/cellobiose epimerase-like protein (N-acyl-D-glucosamine 2-epimerase family)